MIMRVSAKLARKLNVRPTVSIRESGIPFADWSAHLFTASRTQYILVANTATLYAMVMPGREISNAEAFIQRTPNVMKESLGSGSFAPFYEDHIAQYVSSATFSKALNRSVTGSMNDMIHHAKFMLTQRDLSLGEVAQILNDTPFSSLKYLSPRQAFNSLCLEWTESGRESGTT